MMSLSGNGAGDHDGFGAVFIVIADFGAGCWPHQIHFFGRSQSLHGRSSKFMIMGVGVHSLCVLHGLSIATLFVLPNAPGTRYSASHHLLHISLNPLRFKEVCSEI
ncbi:hypothetical protein FB480_11089 [Agrobacterium vitis]|nr:hypothetical protein FB480_11089 [Agrobacterium vitis]